MPEKILSATPDRMVRRYVVGSLISILLVLVSGCYGIYRVTLARVIANAEDSAVSLANAIIDDVSDGFATRAADGTPDLAVDAAAVQELDATLRGFLHHFNIIKIKVFNRQARIIYSTDPALIGKTDRGNLRLANALTGRNDAKVVKKEKVLDFQGNEKFDVDVVETYVPVRDSDGRVIGSFELYQDVTRYYRQMTPFVAVSGGIMLAILASWFQIAYVIIRKEAEQLKAAQEVLRTQANTDFLTGTCNRRQLLVRCEEEMSRLERYLSDGPHQGSVGFIMIDIDHFKRVNDTFGHEAGDHVIRELAERIRKEIRQYDIVGRYGGEEFLVVLPQSTVDDVRAVAERLWHSVRSLPVRYGNREIFVTVSLGVAMAAGETHHEEVIRRADDALYRSKHDGRDRISYAFPEGKGVVHG